MRGKLVNGHAIEANPVRHPHAWQVEPRNDVPHVTIHRMSGGDGTDVWTPAEARAFAAALLAAADEAEVKP